MQQAVRVPTGLQQPSPVEDPPDEELLVPEPPPQPFVPFHEPESLPPVDHVPLTDVPDCVPLAVPEAKSPSKVMLMLDPERLPESVPSAPPANSPERVPDATWKFQLPLSVPLYVPQY